MQAACQTCTISGRPALRFAHDKVTEHLNACDRFELLRIHEVGVELDRIGLAEQLHKPAVFLDEIVGQRSDAEALLACADQAENVVHPEISLARTRAVAAGIDQPAAVLEMRSDLA